MQDYLNQFKNNGYFVIENAFSETQAKRFRELSENYFDNYPSNTFFDGHMCNGWGGVTPEMEELNQFHESDTLLDISRLILGCDDFIFTGHSDLHKNLVALWHRDHIDYGLGAPEKTFEGFNETTFWDGMDVSKPPLPKDEKTVPGFWSNEHKIIKFAILLQDHKDNDLGLWMMSGSHKKGEFGKETCLHTTARDLIVFDHRITHRGQLKNQFVTDHGEDRLLLSWGFGIDNEHTQKFIQGTTKRQQFYRNKMT